MKFLLAVLLLALCMEISIARIEVIEGKKVYPKHDPKPKWGECYRNTAIMCSQAGMRVQYDGEACVDCICDGTQKDKKKGVTCCAYSPYPHVLRPAGCNITLDTNTCTYNREPINPHSRHACCIKFWEVADIDYWAPDDLQPEKKNGAGAKDEPEGKSVKG